MKGGSWPNNVKKRYSKKINGQKETSRRLNAARLSTIYRKTSHCFLVLLHKKCQGPRGRHVGNVKHTCKLVYNVPLPCQHVEWLSNLRRTQHKIPFTSWQSSSHIRSFHTSLIQKILHISTFCPIQTLRAYSFRNYPPSYFRCSKWSLLTIFFAENKFYTFVVSLTFVRFGHLISSFYVPILRPLPRWHWTIMRQLQLGKLRFERGTCRSVPLSLTDVKCKLQ